MQTLPPTIDTISPAVATPAATINPCLENGDRLTRHEFERRCANMPNVRNAQLIEGVVFMPSPVSLVGHAEPHARIVGWLAYYCSLTPDVRIGENATLRLDLDNEPQADAVLSWDAARGGGARVAADGYLEGVPEYLAWRVADGVVDWFELTDGDYRPIPADADGLVRSRQFPGLWLDTAALLCGDLARVVQGLQEGQAPLS